MQTEFTTPIFQVEDDIEAWERLLETAIPQIPPQYFPTNARFKSLGNISSSMLVDYMGLYEEGDWWVLTIIKITDLYGLSKYLFLPLTSRIDGASGGDLDDSLIFGLDNVAFELETFSQLYGRRRWQIFDAFADFQFRR